VVGQARIASSAFAEGQRDVRVARLVGLTALDCGHGNQTAVMPASTLPPQCRTVHGPKPPGRVGRLSLLRSVAEACARCQSLAGGYREARLAHRIAPQAFLAAALWAEATRSEMVCGRHLNRNKAKHTAKTPPAPLYEVIYVDTSAQRAPALPKATARIASVRRIGLEAPYWFPKLGAGSKSARRPHSSAQKHCDEPGKQ
jgi:hypothetical protein